MFQGHHCSLHHGDHINNVTTYIDVDGFSLIPLRVSGAMMLFLDLIFYAEENHIVDFPESSASFFYVALICLLFFMD
jgi:hypothetical protein